MTLVKPVVVNGVTKANAELFNEYGSDLELIANTMLGAGAIGESQLASSLLGPASNKYGLRKLGTGATEALAGNTAILSKAETELIAVEKAAEASRKTALEGARVVATANLTLSGLQTVDGVTLVEGNVVLATEQTEKKNNGKWEVKSGAWVRPTDYANGATLSPAAIFVPVTSGSASHSGSTWLIKTPSTTVTVGTTETTWEENSAGSGVVTGVITTQSRTALGVEALADDETGHFNTAIGYQALQNAKQESFTFTAKITSGSTQLTGLTLTYAEVTAKLNFGGFLSCAAHPGALFPEVTLAMLPTEAEYNAKKELTMEHVALESVTSASILQLWGASYNTVLGYKAAQNVTTGSGNIIIGEIAGGSISTGGENIAIGTEALVHNSTESNLIAIGFAALNETTAGPNIGIGQGALSECTTGVYNLGIGAGALQHNETEPYNVVIGHLSCNNNNGKANTVIGTDCLQKATTASENTCVGWATLSNATSSFNTAIGYFAAGKLTTGAKNTVLGWKSGVLLTTGELNVLLGYNAGGALTTTSNQLYIANSETGEPLIKGEFPNVSLQFNAGKLGFNKKAPVTLIAENLETGALKAAGTVAPFGFETKAEVEKVIKFVEKWSKFMHESGLTA